MINLSKQKGVEIYGLQYILKWKLNDKMFFSSEEMLVLKALFAAFWFSFSYAQRKDIFGPIFATKTSYFVNLYNDTR